MDLSRFISTLASAAGDGFEARPVAEHSVHFIGRDADGAPTLLLGSRDTPHSLNAPIRLKGVVVQFAAPCRLDLPDGQQREQRFTVIRCTAAEPELQRYFLRVCETILRLVGDEPAYVQVTGAVRRLVDLFQRMLKPPAGHVLGLYGELLLITWSPNAHCALKAWRSDGEARFDFAAEDLRIDVKATSGRVRAHRFSLEQCRPAPGTVAIIVSLLIEPGAGLTISELLARIEGRVSDAPELQMKLQEVVAESLGAGVVEGLRAQFDDKAARSSLALFRAEYIPTPQGPIPPSVSEIRFKADLSTTPALSIADVTTESRIASQLLPT